MAGEARPPDFRVSGRSLDGKRWVEVGAAWRSTGDDDVPYISITLNFKPNTHELTLWPIDKERKR